MSLCTCPRPTHEIEQALDRARANRDRFEDWGKAHPETLAEIDAHIEWLLGLLEKAMWARIRDRLCALCRGVVPGMSLEGNLL